jgi:hypothetical protein
VDASTSADPELAAPAKGSASPDYYFPPALYDLCATATSPDVYLYFSGNETGVSGGTSDASYINRSGCKKALIDTYVFAGASTAPANYASTFKVDSEQGQGPYAWVLTQNDCGTLHVRGDVYSRKYGESGFSYIGSVNRDGVWNGSHCFANDTGSLAGTSFAAPATGWDTYRIAVTSQVLGNYQAAAGGTFHPYQL